MKTLNLKPINTPSNQSGSVETHLFDKVYSSVAICWQNFLLLLKSQKSLLIYVIMVAGICSCYVINRVIASPHLPTTCPTIITSFLGSKNNVLDNVVINSINNVPTPQPFGWCVAMVPNSEKFIQAKNNSVYPRIKNNTFLSAHLASKQTIHYWFMAKFVLDYDGKVVVPTVPSKEVPIFIAKNSFYVQQKKVCIDHSEHVVYLNHNYDAIGWIVDQELTS